ncbi:MAG: Gfo/Idh/MocA family oxidoreductase [Gemmatales bacterium]|nr:Gfo/Idh/MocA family oxidoreductase [Gemmatales bacterium]MDW7994072.1 Gfo/Idh/MocA family oxidoreductase [Gemmatales bacterium]
MGQNFSRRGFLWTSVSGTLGWFWGAPANHANVLRANERVGVAVMGLGRGLSLARTFEQQADAQVLYVCDVDRRRIDRAVDQVGKLRGRTPQGVVDFRRFLDDKQVDAVVVATCNHWHAAATILACKAGKHVYVEKPCSHTPREGELMVAVARRYNRLVQMGNQRRSWPVIREAIAALHQGALGRVYQAQSWYTNHRPTIGRGQETSPPSWLDYELWQGPAPRRPYRTNVIHYNWHWFWHWGNGELGNNGVHMIDLCRWGLGVDYPIQVTSSGGRFRYDDDQETPDTHTAAFIYPGNKQVVWHGTSCSRLAGLQPPNVLFVGEKGTMVIRDASYGANYTIYDPEGKIVTQQKGQGGDVEHVHNFLEAIRSGQRLHSEIEEAHKSTLPCHLGNIAYRLGRVLRCDAKSGAILDDREAQGFWSREYQPGWEPSVE